LVDFGYFFTLSNAPFRFVLARILTNIVARRLSRSNAFSNPGYLVSRALWGFPSEPSAVVEIALRELVEQQASNPTAAKTLIWLANMKRPLSLTELCHSLAVQNRNPPELDKDLIAGEGTTVDCCEGLAIFDRGSSLVQLAPYNIKDIAKRCLPDLYNEEVSALAIACLNYLLLPEFETGPCKTEEDLVNLLREYPFLDYAARWWAYHVRDAQDVYFQSDNTHKKYAQGSSDRNSLKSDEVQGSDKHNEDDCNPTTNLTYLFGKFQNIFLAMQVYLYKDCATPIPADRWDTLLKKVETMTRLHIAARFGMTLLIDKIAVDGIAADSEGSIPLHEAAKEGFNDVVARLLKTTHTPVAVMDHYNKTPMHYALAGGHTGIFAALFERACSDLGTTSFREIDDAGEFVTFYCASNESSCKSDNGQRSKEIAMMNAIKRGKSAVIDVLLRAGADPSCKNEEGFSAIHLAIQRKSSEGMPDKTLEILLGYGADPSAKTAGGEPALHLAAKLGKYDAMKTLLYYCADAKAVDSHQNTALFPALLSNQSDLDIEDMVEVLIRNYVDVDAINDERRCILHEAARNGNVRILEKFWRMDDYNQKDMYGKTPLDCAQDAGREDAARCLSRWIDLRRRLNEPS
jgi:ankyrin repeat protein